MGNMKEVNKVLKAKYPHLDIKAVRGQGYVYFVLGVHDVDSLHANPVSTSTEILSRLVLEHIEGFMSDNHLI